MSLAKVLWRLCFSNPNRAQAYRQSNCDFNRAAKKTDDTSASANVCSGAQCCLFNSGIRFGLLLSWTVLPVSLPGPLLQISLWRALLSAPALGCRRLWSPWVLSLLVNSLTLRSAAPHRSLNRPCARASRSRCQLHRKRESRRCALSGEALPKN